jgi:hypothetical protein
MAGENSHLRFPKRSGYLSSGHPKPGDPGIRSERGERNARRREAGLRIVATEMENSPIAQEERSRPRVGRKSNRTFDNRGGLAPLSTQIDPVGRQLLDELDPEDPAYRSKYRGIIAEHTRVWEELGATPLIIDFSNVQEPIAPQRLHPSHKLSQHPERPLYVWAFKNAHAAYPQKSDEGRRHREEWYWEQMDKGMLPPTFNPYAPGSPKHHAFENRHVLVDDRPTSKTFSAVTRRDTGEPQEVLDTPRQLRARARRKLQAGGKLSEEEFVALCGKPIEEWDLEELAKGRTKDINGEFKGRAPSAYMARETQERIETLFKQRVRGSMNETTVNALSTLSQVLDNDDVDMRGKPVVAASTKVDVAKFLVEHLLGKPKQTVESDISVKLQGVLASVMVAPEHAMPPAGSTDPVSPTGRMFAGQRGYRQDYEDSELKALERAGIIDAVVVDDDDLEEGGE